MAGELINRGAAITLILHSPLLRAVQTAAEVAGVLKPAKGKEEFVPLDNTRPPEDVAREIAARAADVDEVLAIGHQPQIGEIAVLLGKALLEFRPASIAAIDLASEPRVLWALSPDQPG